MIYHILNDEKFSDWVIEVFSEINPDNNRFIVVSDTSSTKFLNNADIEVFNRRKFLIEFNPQAEDLIIFYFLHLHSISFLRKKGKGRKILWVGYGADYYYYLLNNEHFGSLYLPETEKIRKRINKRKGIRRFFLPAYQRLFFHFKVKPALKNVKYFAPILPNEYDIIKSEYPYLKFEPVRFTFGDIEYLLSRNELSTSVSGNKILIGNSATLANNHIDILKLLKSQKCNNQLVVPVSYGDEKYKAVLHEYCTSTLGSQVELLNDFLPRSQYFDLLKECEYVIMGHLRQQAMGNIYASLYMGAKLFVFRKNPVFAFLKTMGVVIFEIEELKNNLNHLKSPLSSFEKTKNREIVGSYYAKHAVKNRVMDIVSL